MQAKKGSNSTKKYAVSGKTLKEINDDVGKKGPGGGQEFGECQGTLAVAPVGAADLASDNPPIEVTATFKGGTITLTTVITVPTLASERALSPNALKEWKRFLAALQVHEQGHADSFFTLAGTIADEFNALSAKATDKDQRKAQAAAQKALVDLYTKTYGGSVLKDRVNADAAAYDSKTRHGATQGAVLDTTIT